MENIDNIMPVFDEDVFNSVKETPQKPTQTKEDSTPNEDVVEDSIPQEDNQDVLELLNKSISDDPQPVEEVEEEVTSDNRLATLYYNTLVEKGIATPQEDKEEYTWDDVESATNYYTQELPHQIADQLVKQAPELGQQLIDFVFTKGQNLTKEDLTQFTKEYLEDISSVEINTEDDARSYLEQVYSKQFSRKSQVQAAIEALEDEGALVDEAKKHLETKPKKSQQTLQQIKEEQNNIREQQRQFAEQVIQELNNTGWANNKINTIKQNLTNGRVNEVLKKASSNPKALIQLADFINTFDENSSEFDLKNFKVQATSNQVKSLKDKITEDMFNSAASSTKASSSKVKKKFDLDKLRPII